MYSWIGKLLLTGAMLFLILVIGSAAIWFEFFPGPQLKKSFQAFEAVATMRRQQSRDFNAGGVYPASHDFRGVTRGDSELWQEGYTLYTTAQGQAVRLVDMQGTEVHRWELSYHDMWEEGDEVQNLVPERFVYVRNAKLYPNGDLLLSFSAWTTTPFGFGIAMIDRDSNVLWKNFRPVHHSFDQAADGTIYALDHIVIDAPKGWLGMQDPYLDDGIAIFTADGEYVKHISLLESLRDSVYRPVIQALALNNASAGLGDLLHANDVEVLTEDIAPFFPFGESGDLLVSMREISAVAILDVKTETISWLARGDWNSQHDPDFLPNGNIILFNNIDMQLDAAGNRVSSVVEFDPVTRAVTWSFSGSADEPMFTSARGSQQRLTNGNTLITESQGGHVLEVTSEGNVVWEYYVPDRYGSKAVQLPSIFWATRYELDEIDFAFNRPSIQ
jgi:hypothetical protein